MKLSTRPNSNIYFQIISDLAFCPPDNKQGGYLPPRISNNGEPKEIHVEGLCNKVTPLDIEEGVKGKSQHWKRVSGLDLN